MLELAIAEAVEHAERMLKTFESGCAVAQDLLQMMIDKLEVVRQRAVAAPQAAGDPQFPGEPVLYRSPEGVFVEGAGVVSTEHLAAAGVPVTAPAPALAPEEAPAPTQATAVSDPAVSDPAAGSTIVSDASQPAT